MKKALSAAMALVICLVLLMTSSSAVFAGSGEFDFSASPSTTVTRIGHVHSITMNTSAAFTRCTGSDVRFRFRVTSDNYGWLGLALDNSGPNGLGSGSGIRSVLFFRASASIVSRVVSPTCGWDAAANAHQFQNGSIRSGAESADYDFNDGEWHTVSVTRTDGVWSMLVDGKNAMNTPYSGLDAELTSMLSGTDSTYLVFFTDTGSGSVEVEQIMDEATDKAALLEEIRYANELKDDAVIGTTGGTYPQAAYNTFAGVIASVQGVYDNASSSPSDIAAAIGALRQAEYIFVGSVISSVDLTGLNETLACAAQVRGKVRIGTAVGNVTQAKYDIFNTAYSSAVTVSGDPAATQSAVNSADTMLRNAMSSLLANAVPVSGDQRPFDFVGEAIIAGKDAAAINIIDDVVTVNMPDTGSTAHSAVTGSKLEFCFRIDPEVNCQWFGLILSNSGWTSLGGGDGINLLIWNNNYAVTGYTVENRAGKHWGECAEKMFSNTALGTDGGVINDGMWHSFRMARESGGWIMTIDGHNCISNRYSGFDMDMDRLLGPINPTVTLSLFTNGDPAMMELSQNMDKTSSASMEGLDALYRSGCALLNATAADACTVPARTAFGDALEATASFMAQSGLTVTQIREQEQTLKRATGIFKADIITTANHNLPEEPNDPAPTVLYAITRPVSAGYRIEGTVYDAGTPLAAIPVDNSRGYFLGYYIDEELVTPYTGTTADGIIDLYPKYCVPAGDLAIEGVQVRLTAKSGLRFIANISKDALAGVRVDAADVSYGVLMQIARNADNARFALENAVDKAPASGELIRVECDPARVFGETADTLRYTAVLTGMPASYFGTPIAVRAYLSYIDASGIRRTYYSDETGAGRDTVYYDVTMKQAASATMTYAAQHALYFTPEQSAILSGITDAG